MMTPRPRSGRAEDAATVSVPARQSVGSFSSIR
jgi:hypothetical protein